MLENSIFAEPSASAPEPTTPEPAPEPDYEEYTVEPGDNLSAIASRFGTTWQKIAEDNDIENPDVIYPGQTLKIYKGDAGGGRVVDYAVRRGDTLSGIAAEYGTTWQKIAEDNGLDNPDVIFPGQRLKIYL